MNDRANNESVAVVGMGNLLMTDEGVGIHALRALKTRIRNPAVRWIDGGTDAWSSLHAAQGCRHLVVLDAVRGGEKPGTLYRLSLDEIEQNVDPVSLHEISLLQLASGCCAAGVGFNTVRLVGMEPAEVEMGIGLSPACRAELDSLMAAAGDEIEKLINDKVTEGVRPC